MNSTQTTIGMADPHRQERLLSLATLLGRSDGGTVNLRFPDISDVLIADNRRDLTFIDGAGTSRLQTFENQIRPHSAIMRAGATAITLQVHETSTLPSIDRSKKAAWTGTSADVAPTLDLTASTPKRLSAFITASKQLLKLSPMLAGAFLERQLLSALAASLDDAAVNGIGGTDEPFGLLQDPNLAEYVLAGANISLADILGMEKAVADSHGEADPVAMGWISDTATRKTLRSTPRSAELTSPIWTDGPFGGPVGHRGTASPFAPADTLIYGHMPDLMILQSGIIEIMANPYAADTEGFVRLTVNSYFDIVALNPERSFVRAVPAP